jgi:ABC-type uncharacterized transport system ATPase subunit
MGSIESLEFCQITKSFFGHKANDHINLKIGKGEIIGLLGENGAGKTTLMNILFGIYKPDSGHIEINGQAASFNGPRDAIQSGIGMVHQHFMLVDKHDVVEKYRSQPARYPLLVPAKKNPGAYPENHGHHGLEVNLDKKIWELSAGEQQRVEILKAMVQGVEFLILDEPTSVLTPVEVTQLFDFVRNMKERGKTVIIITHKMDEIIEICDRVVVLRKGAITGTADPKTMNKQDLAQWMVGRNIQLKLDKSPYNPGDTVLEVMDLEVHDDRGLVAVDDATFHLRQREILGIAGVSGNGQRELVEAITGLRRPSYGSIVLEHQDITNESARVKSNLGIAHIPEERIRFGIVPNMLIHENAILKKHHTQPFTKVWFLDHDEIHKHAEDVIQNFEVSAPSRKSATKNLSGGNIQKLILGREISAQPSLLVASHPTYGLDVGATEYVRKQLIEMRERGGAVLLVSEDLEELMAISDRIMIMSGGKIRGIFKPEETSIEEIGLKMSGANHS